MAHTGLGHDLRHVNHDFLPELPGRSPSRVAPYKGEHLRLLSMRDVKGCGFRNSWNLQVKPLKPHPFSFLPRHAPLALACNMAQICMKNWCKTGGLHHGHWYLNALFHLLLDLSSVAGARELQILISNLRCLLHGSRRVKLQKDETVYIKPFFQNISRILSST